VVLPDTKSTLLRETEVPIPWAPPPIDPGLTFPSLVIPAKEDSAIATCYCNVVQLAFPIEVQAASQFRSATALADAGIRRPYLP
jgi:hypothetical protein